MTEQKEEPTQLKRSNPWGNKNEETSNQSLHSIMKEQQQQINKEIDTMKDVDEDEAMRLAVEASLLYEINSKNVKKYDDLDLAIKLSLNDCKHKEDKDESKNKDDNLMLKDDSKYGEKTAETEDNDDVDDDMKLAMKLSLNETKEAESTKEKEVPLKEDPKYANYFLMKEMNVDVIDIKQLMKNDGIDESILDLNPNKSLKEQSKDTPKKDVSYEIALQLQREEDSYSAMMQQQKQKSITSDKVNSVRTVSRHEFEKQKQALNNTSQPHHMDHEEDDYDDEYEEYEYNDSGFRLNSNTNSNVSSSWKRDKASPYSIKGPNGEIRTKHDIELKHISNAQRLSYNDKNNKATTSVSDNAYNSLNQKMKRYTNKGVATHGHGKSEQYDDKTRGGVMDASVRLILQKAINNDIITQLNGVVSEGKEALVYHADKNSAVKVFKRIQEFRNRGEYVDGDVRYYDKPFSKVDKRSQLELWAEKEYRNLIRANRGYIPTPRPIYHKQNVIIMSFLGTDNEDGTSAWPAPKLKDISLKFGSSKWIHFYCLIIVYIKKLYHVANLIHADLSEYNVLIVPSSQIKYDNALQTKITENKDNPQEEDTLQVAFIDFGQSVDASHPKAMEYLKRDIDRISKFFNKAGGVSVLKVDDIVSFIMSFDYHESEEEWEFTGGSSSDYKECNPNDIEEEYILISKDEQEPEEKRDSSNYRKGCFRKLNKWDDELEYESILKKVVV